MRKLNHLFVHGLNLMVSLFSSATYMTIDFNFNPVLACKPHGPNDFSGGEQVASFPFQEIQVYHYAHMTKEYA